MAWQQRARIGVALVGIAIAGLVYLRLGTREAPVRSATVNRVDPFAMSETAGANLQQLQGLRRDYRIEAARQLTYADGNTSFLDLRVTVEDHEGRDFIVTGGRAQVGVAGSELAMAEGVALQASDGFALNTDEAVFSEATGVVTAPGPTVFSRAGLTGTGVGMTYDTNVDFLTIETDTEVSLTDADGGRIDFTADSLFFDRAGQVLALTGGVGIRWGGDVLQADRVNVELDERGERATFIALRDDATASMPGGTVKSMEAQAIDFDYTADGLVLERLALGGGSVVELAGQDEATGGRVRGRNIEVVLNADGGLGSLGAVDDVRLEVPVGEGALGVSADRLDGVGQAGMLRTAYFQGSVVFAEERDAFGSRHRAEAAQLALDLSGGGVGLASFDGGARFTSGTVTATGFQAEYSPGNGELRLRGTVGTARPRVADARVTIEAETIDMLLDPMTVYAGGDVQTTIAGGRGAGALQLPSLVDDRQPVTILGGRLEYGGNPAVIRYSEGVVLRQGETMVRAARLEIDQASGNLRAEEAAQATFMLDGTRSIVTAPAIWFDEAARVLTYGEGPTTDGVSTPGSPRVPPPAADPPTTPVRLSGAQGDLTAGDIVVRLADEMTSVSAIEASRGVRLLLDGRTATGNVMRYAAADGRYVLEGTPAAPAVLVDACRWTEGLRLTFTPDEEQVVVEGGQQVRTRTTGTPCPGVTTEP